MRFPHLPPLTASFLLTGLLPLSAGEPGSAAAPAQAQAAFTPASSGWEVTLSMPGWLSGLEGTTGIGGTAVDVDVAFEDLVKQLDMAASLDVEVRKGRWGVILDGMYMKLSSGGQPPGPLFKTVDVEIEQVIAEASLNYRLLQWDRGWLDVYAGARCFYMGGDMHLTVDKPGVRQFSDNLAAQATDAAIAAARREVDKALPSLKAAANEKVAALTDSLRTAADRRIETLKDGVRTKAGEKVAQVQEEIRQRIEEIIAGRPGHHPSHRPGQAGRPLNHITGSAMAAVRPGIDAARAVAGSGAVANAIKELAQARVDAKLAEVRELARARVDAAVDEVEARVAQVKQQLKKEAQRRIQRAEQKLGRAIEKAILDKLPTDLSGSKTWVDPIVGFRARHHFNDWFYSTVRADIGGFGVGSDLEWQVYAALGFNLSKHTTLELGYRHMDVDYTSGGFTFDAALSGAVLALGYTF